jgi:hypothetical protein
VNVPASYEVDHDIVVLRVTADTFTRLAEDVRIACLDTAAGARMRLLIDLRAALSGLNYEDMRSQAQKLAAMGTILAPQWAVLTTNKPIALSTAQMFATLAEIEHASVQVFDDEQEALFWLRQWREGP